MLIFDEVQAGVGLTGKMWAHEHFGVQPDMLCFGKKLQMGGVMASTRIDEVPGNVFKKSGRINSTWGGNLADMVRATTYLEIIQEEDLVGERRASWARRFSRVFTRSRRSTPGWSPTSAGAG